VNLTSQRRLIVNADDFGLTRGVNEGIAEAFEHGILTSASLMVLTRAAEDAARYATAHPTLSVGLHLDLGEWVHESGRWVAVYEVVNMEDSVAVSTELARQLALFRDLTGADPTHLDSHQHVHREEPARSAVAHAAGQLGIPARDLTSKVRYSGDFYGQTARGEPIASALTADRLARIIADLPPGTTELGCHPGRDPDLASPYRSERELEVEALTDPRVRARIEAHEIQLTSFATLRPERGPSKSRSTTGAMSTC
jgi:predicted glycoside hydrolase/deacetylase ChbG (UPF0249 family)